MEQGNLNHQLVEMIRDRFDAVDAQLGLTREAFADHLVKDEKYWKKIDEQQAQMTLISRVFWGLVSLIGVVLGWLGIKH